MTKLETPVVSLAEGGEAPTDGELLARWCAKGDTRALELVIRRHGGMVLGVCRRVLGNTPDADDAFQATFLVFIQKAQKLAHPEQVAGWLHAVALRVARKAQWKRGRQREREAASVDNLELPDPTTPDPATDSAAEARELRQTLDDELDRLPEKYRLPIVLCELEGRTLEEAAQLLGWPKGTVAGRLSRGREMLRQRLSRRGIGLPLFLIFPLPAFGPLVPSDPLVSATITTATASASGQGAAPAAATVLAQSVLRDGLVRKLGLFAIVLTVAGLIGFLGWQARAATAQPPSTPPAPLPASGGCHAHTS
jgi:RNA polymerase sigma factor (sigma-70 family)